MDRARLDQATLAAAAGVSQPTVSRALSGTPPRRRGQAYLKLLAYIDTQTRGTKLPAEGKRRVERAFEKIWDGTEVHAAVVAKLIEDLEGLRPSRELRQRRERRKRT